MGEIFDERGCLSVATIPELRAAFDKMSAKQKGEFILRLKAKLQQGPASSEQTQFLNECIAKYNAARTVPNGNSGNQPAANHSGTAEVKASRGCGSFIFAFVALVLIMYGIISLVNSCSEEKGDINSFEKARSYISDTLDIPEDLLSNIVYHNRGNTWWLSFLDISDEGKHRAKTVEGKEITGYILDLEYGYTWRDIPHPSFIVMGNGDIYVETNLGYERVS